MANSLPAKLTSLTFGGFDCQKSDLSVQLDIKNGLNDGLEVRGEDTVVPGLAGRVPRDRKRDTRHIVLTGWIQGVGASEALRLADFQDTCNEVEAAFPLDGSPAALAGTDRSSDARSILARTTNLIWDDEPAWGVAYVTIMLDSVEPDW